MARNQLNLQNATKPSEEANNGVEKLIKHYQLNDDEKHGFYRILKHLLKEPSSLQDGKWDNYVTLRLVYGKESCKITVFDLTGNIREKAFVATLDIYLRWRVVEDASLANLQKVHNELRFLGVQNEKVDACFSLAKREFVKEPPCSVKKNCTLQIICDDVVLLFLSGKGENEIIVFYDDEKNTPVYHLSVRENEKHVTGKKIMCGCL